MNVLGISCAGNTAIKLPWEILDVFAVYQMGFWWVHCPFPCDVLAVFPLGTPPLAPSVRDSADARGTSLGSRFDTIDNGGESC